jgi:hypothetical protein
MFTDKFADFLPPKWSMNLGTSESSGQILSHLNPRVLAAALGLP